MPEVRADIINEYIDRDKEGYIEKCEKVYREKLAEISEKICLHQGRTLFLLAGPSSSGKTTTAKLLAADIIKAGRHATVISLDDFYRDQEESFYFEDGTVDYETVKALDTDRIVICMQELLHNGASFIPHFSFQTKLREGYNEVRVSEDEIIIVEGLHALNPVITDCLENENIMKAYVSVSSRIFDSDGRVLLSKRDMRFVRRLIRDYHFRNSQVENTFYLWKGVRMGEDRYLFPFSSRADIRIDSIHPYEVCVFKNIAIKLLDHIQADSIYYPSAQLLREKLSGFVSIQESDVPDTSLLKEFIG